MGDGYYSGPPTGGTYLKAPLSALPVPRRRCSPPRPGAGATQEAVDCDDSAAWYVVRSMDVVQHDLAQVSKASRPIRNGGPPQGAPLLQDMMDACRADDQCAGFNFPGGWMKSSTHPADMTHVADASMSVFSKSELPPQDYITATVFSLLEEMMGSSNVSSSAGLNRGCGNAGSPFGGRVHLYVMDTSPLSVHVNPSRPGVLAASERGPMSDEYWFRAFAWLRKHYAHLPCVSFVPATSYTRLSERSMPPTRGMPEFHPDNQRKNMLRGLVQQTLDFVSALRYAAAASPAAHALVWEDDCFACKGSLREIDNVVRTISRFDPNWGSVKVGNGGSGMLFHASVVGNLLPYLQTRRGSENVDVSMWRYLNSGGFSDYISKTTLSAHRGLQSSLRLSAGIQWGRVKCNGLLDRHWGWYKECDMSRIAALLPGGAASAGDDVAALVKGWDCSVYSPATDGSISP
jgi:hypothetical protein